MGVLTTRVPAVSGARATDRAEHRTPVRRLYAESDKYAIRRADVPDLASVRCYADYGDLRSI